MVKGIIFDCDGVIVDSEVFYLGQLKDFLAEKGYTTNIEDVMYVVGRSGMDIAELLKKQFNMPEAIEEIDLQKRTYHQTHMDFTKFQPMTGVHQFIDKCKEKGIKLSVASSSSYEYLDKVLTRFHIKDDFSFILSGIDFAHSKPDPEIYNVAASRMGISKDELIVIEDSVNGIKAGKAAGMRVIGFKGSVVKQDTSEADEEVFSFDEIKL